MKKHRLAGFIPCILAAIGLAAFAFVLRSETLSYRRAVEKWAERDLAARTQLASEAIREALATGDFARLRAFADARRMDGMRLTVLTRAGGMFFDSDSRAVGNHASCPEVAAAREKGEGTSLRKSETSSSIMLYCARCAGDEFIVRLALPYETVVAPLRANRPVLVFAALVGASGILMVLLFTFRLVVRYRTLAREREAQERALAETRRLAEFRRAFIANVSHEIKTPLTGILGAVDMLETSGDALSEDERHELMNMLRRESTRLDALARDILSLARIERGDEDGARSFAPADLADVLSSAADRVRPRAEKAGVRLVVHPADPLVAQCDSRLIEQALVNLADNALRYSASPDVEMSLAPCDGGAVFTVEDHGVGLSAADRARIFERFYRVDKSHSREQGGTGLGLAIVKHIATLHGGDAQVESEPGKGCRFTLRIKCG